MRCLCIGGLGVVGAWRCERVRVYDGCFGILTAMGLSDEAISLNSYTVLEGLNKLDL